jgi:hypothetical protein
LRNLFEIAGKGRTFDQGDPVIDGVRKSKWGQEAGIAAVCRTTKDDVLAVEIAVEELQLGFEKSNQSTTLVMT